MMSEHQSTSDKGDDNEHITVPAAPQVPQGAASDQSQQREDAPVPLGRDGRDKDRATADRGAGEVQSGEGAPGEPDSQGIKSVAQALLHIERSESYSGILPDGKNWNQYEPETKERMLRIAEAGTTDESRRRDGFLEVQLKEIPRSRRTSACLFAAAMVCSLIAGGVFHDTVLACTFIAGPVIYGALGFLPSSGSRGRRDADSKSENE